MSWPARFWWKVDFTGSPIGCWVWLGAKTVERYGRVTHKGEHIPATHIAWELTNGPIPDGLWVLHRCDNPPCVNPSHLFLGTQADNNRDTAQKGRFRYRKPSKKLNWQQVEEIRRVYALGQTTQKEIARQYHVRPSTISGIIQLKRWNPDTKGTLT